jgi:tetratricopeptide (TPR) repeat protein
VKRYISIIVIAPSIAYALSSHHLHQFMWANIDTFGNNPQRALQRYNHIAHESIWTYHGYIPFLFDHNKYSTIVSLAPKIDTHFANNADIQLLLALSFKKINNHSEGNKRILSLGSQHPTNAKIALRTAQTYVELKEHHNALTVLNTYLNKSPHKTNSFLFYFLKGQIYAQLKEYTQALENIELCLNLQPSYSQAWLVRAILEEQKGNIENAITGYSNFLGLINDNTNPLHQHLTKLMLQQSVAQNSVKNLSQSYESHLDAAILCFTRNQHQQAMAECNNYLREHPESIKAKLLKIQIYTAQNNYSQAIELLCKEINHTPDNDLWYKTLYHLKKKFNGRYDLEIIFKDLAKKYPDNLLAQLYTADIVLRSTHPREALPYLKHAEPLATNSQQKVALLYQQALIFYDTHDINNAESALKKIIALEKTNAPAHNLLAYIAAKQKTYTQAHTLINTALAHDPHNYHYLDTKGYIFYKEKKYQEAEKIFVEIASKCHNDTHVLAHLKKTYNKQNKKEHEQTFFKKIAALDNHQTKEITAQKKT